MGAGSDGVEAVCVVACGDADSVDVRGRRPLGCGTATRCIDGGENFVALQLKNAEEKSALAKLVSGSSMAARATPPGCTKFMGRGFMATSSVAAAPVSMA